MITFEEKQEALEASRILTSSVFQRVFTDIDSSLVSNWRTSDDQEEREHCWMMLQCLHAIRKEMMDRIQCAALKERGKDEALNTALKNAKNAKGKKNG